jgi:mannose-1-phosphate guanylyltransferase
MIEAPWAVVLAGGDGDRVSAMTRNADGATVPKQFWRCQGRPPMVRWALARARRMAAPANVLVAVKEGHRAFWEQALGDVPRRNILVQPENRGTAAGVLRALVEIQSRESTVATVALLPSDHYVDNEDVLHAALVSAVRTACHADLPVVLLGMSPAGPESDYGWIQPESAGSFARVRRFVEKPPPACVRDLMRDGALINSFILAARVHALLAIIGHAFPDILRAFQRVAREPHDAPAVRRLYEGLPAMDLSRDVLRHATAYLSVARVPPCGWIDLGTRERLQRYLDDPPWRPEHHPPMPHPAAA